MGWGYGHAVVRKKGLVGQRLAQPEDETHADHGQGKMLVDGGDSRGVQRAVLQHSQHHVQRILCPLGLLLTPR